LSLSPELVAPNVDDGDIVDLATLLNCQFSVDISTFVRRLQGWDARSYGDGKAGRDAKSLQGIDDLLILIVDCSVHVLHNTTM
jgi:hypothetical protein